MSIRGIYHPQTDMIVIDTASHLFGNPVPVMFHEQTHYYLSNYTNFGAVYSLLSKALADPQKAGVANPPLEPIIKSLHEKNYLPQEGIAHLIQYLRLRDESGITIKDFEAPLPNKPKIAFNYLHFATKVNKELADIITGKISSLSMNTGLHQAVLASDILNSQNLDLYLSESSNNPDARFVKLCSALEKDPSLAERDDQTICATAGIEYFPLITNAEKAALINKINAVVGVMSNVQESDINGLKTTEDALLPSYEEMSFRDANIVARSENNHDPDAWVADLTFFRTIFMFDNPETVVHQGLVGYYAFLQNSRTINGRLRIQGIDKFVGNPLMTKVVDTSTYDYERISVKETRLFTRPNIIWYKSFTDFKVFLEAAEKHSLDLEANYSAFTESHGCCFFIFRIKQHQDVLHILASHPFFMARIDSGPYKIEKINFFELIKGHEVHINNFLHDVIGIPWQFDIVEMAKDAKAFLAHAQQKFKNGIGRNEKCLCGSQRKYKKCHGY